MGAFSSLTYHVIFGTKLRAKLIHNSFQERLYEYMGGTLRGLKGHLIEIGGIDDHVHVLANLSPAIAVSEAIRDIKAMSSKWINQQKLIRARFEWQKSYSAFSVSFSNIETVVRYIRRQAEHHRKKSFHEEYIDFLRRHRIDFDPRYLFEDEHVR